MTEYTRVAKCCLCWEDVAVEEAVEYHLPDLICLAHAACAEHATYDQAEVVPSLWRRRGLS